MTQSPVAPEQTTPTGTARFSRRTGFPGRAVGEFLLIVAGVLTALAADGWREDHSNTRLEQEYLGRVTTDLGVDTATHNSNLQDLMSKQAALDAVLSWIAQPDMGDGALHELARNIVEGSRQSYVAAVYAETATFDELVSTGRLQLLRSVELRSMLAAYHRRVGVNRDRLRERETGYAALSYRFVRRGTSEYTLPEDLTAPELARIGSMALSELAPLALAESTRTKVHIAATREHLRRASELLTLLQER